MHNVRLPGNQRQDQALFFEEVAEFDFTVAHNIRVRSASALVFLKEIGEHFIVILLFKVHCVIWNPDLIADPGYVLGIFFCCTMPEFVCVIPVFHEDADDIVSLLLQQQRGNRGIDPAGHPDYNTGVCL